MLNSPSPNTLMHLHSELLFTYDAQGRMVAINEPGGGPAPLLFYGRTGGIGHTVENALWRFGAGLPNELCAQLDTALKHLAPSDSREGPSFHSEELRVLLHKYYPSLRLEEGPAYLLPEMPAFDTLVAADRLINIEHHNLNLLPDDYSETHAFLSERQPCIIKMEHEQIASICMSSRSTADACEAGLQTFEPYRRRGYATQVTRAWAAGVQARGRLALYSTNWQNLASQGVAQRLGAIYYGASLSIFERKVH